MKMKYPAENMSQFVAAAAHLILFGNLWTERWHEGSDSERRIPWIETFKYKR